MLQQPKTVARGRFVAYYRVSTRRQGRSGLGLEAQQNAVKEYLNGGNWKLIAEVTEVESGKRSDNRPELARALDLCRVYNAKLLVAKLDRLSRNVAFISSLMESGVQFVAVDFPQANELTVHLLSAMAQFEAKAISERTKSALAAAKRRGVVLGGDRGNLNAALRRRATKESAIVRSQRAEEYAQRLLPVIEDIRSKGATSLREIAAVLNEREIATPRGTGVWSSMQVSRVLNYSKQG